VVSGALAGERGRSGNWENKENPDDPEITEDKTEWCGGEAVWIGRAVPPVRPAEGPRSGDRDEAPKSEHGNATNVAAGSADLANSGVGGSHAQVITKNSEFNPEQGALPDRRGGIVGAGG
jgi:hypothetical protein